jgi:hypothetical protein
MEKNKGHKRNEKHERRVRRKRGREEGIGKIEKF